jgi:hypothetical protein
VRCTQKSPDEVQPEDILGARGGEGDAIRFGESIEFGGNVWRGIPRKNRLFLDRDDVDAVLQADRKMVAHGAQVAANADHGDIGPVRERQVRVRVNRDANFAPETCHVAEVAPDLLRTTPDGADNRHALVEQQPCQDRPHLPHPIDDRTQITHQA